MLSHNKMKRTKKLTIEEYQSPTAYNKKADILKLVQFEEKLRVKTETPPLPKYEKPPKQEEKNVLLLALSILRP